MQQWEYLVVGCVDEMVVTVNGNRVGKTGLISSPKGEHIWNYLNLRGSEGWEVVTATTDQYNAMPVYTLKRPVLQDASL